jgi:hypothetical protein
MSSHVVNEAFLGALERLRGTGFEFEGYLSNHGPMASDALVELGASDTVLAWVDLYRVRLDAEPEPGEPIIEEDDAWRGALGDFTRVSDWTEFFRRALSEGAWDDVLTRWWPRLVPGLAAAATHGLIRTAHAVRAISRAESVDDLLLRELAHGLGYWSARYEELPVRAPDLTGSRPVGQVIDATAAMDQGHLSDAPGIMPRLLQVDRMKGYQKALEEASLGQTVEATLTDVTAAAARAFVTHPGPAIPLVHSVTAPAAVKLVLPHLPATLHRASLARAVEISSALVATFGSPATQPVPNDIPAVDELVGRVVEHRDEHVIKMAEACLREYAVRPDPHYLLAAEAALQAIDPLV